MICNDNNKLNFSICCLAPIRGIKVLGKGSVLLGVSVLALQVSLCIYKHTNILCEKSFYSSQTSRTLVFLNLKDPLDIGKVMEVKNIFVYYELL